MRLSFLGAAREVTGSNILVETEGKKILLDCGLYQGSSLAEERNYSPFSYNPASIDFVIVCHAHLDHTGRLPKLFKEGFRGKIFSTSPTKDLAKIVLEDTEKLMWEEAKRNGHKPLYGKGDVAKVLELFECIDYEQKIEISPGITLVLKNAGHILGSSIAVLESEGKRLVYTSDLGNKPSQLLEDPVTVENADFVICESTYGGRIHEDASRRREKLTSVIEKTIVTGGVLMIPSFAIERTQELLHDIEHFCEEGKCAIPRFYLDSPLAQKATLIFEKYPKFIKSAVNENHKDGNIFGLKRIIMSSSVEDSKEIDTAPNPKIIIAGSGMMNGGRILFHLQNYIEDAKNTLLIVGYQAVGTLGRRIFDGEKTIKIFGQNYDVRANVVTIGSYSAHADGAQIVQWLSKISGVKKVFLVHGESQQAVLLSKNITRTLGFDCVIPQNREEHEL